MSTINEIIDTLTEKTQALEPFGKKIKLLLDENIIIIDGTTTPPSIITTDTEVDITATSSIEIFSKIINKKMNVQMAMMSGKIKTKGDMMAAVPLMKLL